MDAAVAYEIPLTPQSQTLSVSLGGAQYKLAVTWRDAASTWYLDIADAAGNPLISGLPLVTGGDLLAQFSYVGITGELWVLSQTGEAPALSDLGVSTKLIYVPA